MPRLHTLYPQLARLCAVLVLLFHVSMMSAQDVDLGTANNFAILAGATITSTGATVIDGGSVGVSPGNAVTGFPPAIIVPPFTLHQGDAVALQAKNDLTTAYNAAAGFAPNQNLTGQDLGGLTLTPGIYFFASSAQLTGTLTLNNQGNADAVFIFQIGSSLTTASHSSVVTINDGLTPGVIPGISVFWQVGSSATLGSGSDFEGNILALTSITATTGAVIDGRLLAENGAVTLDGNLVTAPRAEIIGAELSVPDTANTLILLLASFSILLCAQGRFTNLRD